MNKEIDREGLVKILNLICSGDVEIANIGKAYLKDTKFYIECKNVGIKGPIFTNTLPYGDFVDKFINSKDYFIKFQLDDYVNHELKCISFNLYNCFVNNELTNNFS